MTYSVANELNLLRVILVASVVLLQMLVYLHPRVYSEEILSRVHFNISD